MLKFLNRLVLNAKFNIEDICSVYKRLKIDAGDDSDTLSYIQFMVAILPPSSASTAFGTSALNTMRGTPLNQSIDEDGWQSSKKTPV